MTDIAHGLAFVLLAEAALVLLWLILRLRSRQDASAPTGVAGARRLEQNIRDLTDELHRLADDVDEKFATRLAEMRQLHADVEAKVTQLGADAAEAAPQRPSAHQDTPPAKAGQEQHAPTTEGDADADSPAPQPARTSRAQEIRELAAEGLDGPEIARRLNRPIGEVELILRLQRSATAH